jgi:hypothetical protein
MLNDINNCTIFPKMASLVASSIQYGNFPPCKGNFINVIHMPFLRLINFDNLN